MQALKKYSPGIIMLLISLIFLSQAISMEKASIFDPAGGSFLPALIAFIMLITGVIVIIQQLPKRHNESTQGTDKNEKEMGFTGKEYRFILTFFLMILVYVILLSIISFFPATFIYLVISMIYLRGVSWKVNLLVSIGSVIIIYLLFSKLFHIIFP